MPDKCAECGKEITKDYFTDYGHVEGKYCSLECLKKGYFERGEKRDDDFSKNEPWREQ